MRRLGLALLAVCILGAPSAFAARGTGPGGYTWKDCFEPDGPICDYVLTASSDGLTGLCSDEVYRIPGGFGFTFPFYGVNYTALYVSGNGTAYFGTRPGPDPDNNPLTGMEGRPFVAVLWDDWAMDNDDEFAIICNDPGCSNSGPLTFVESYQTGSGTDAIGNFFEIGWYSTAHHYPICTEDFGQQATFGVRFYQNGSILMLYDDTDLGDASLDDGASATIGVSKGTLGSYTQASFDTASIPQNPYAILFEPPPPGCPGLNCGAITIDPNPACDGDSQTLQLATTGGQGAITVRWDTDGDTVSDVTGNPVNVTLPLGANAIRATATDSCTTPGAQTCSQTATATVNTCGGCTPLQCLDIAVTPNPGCEGSPQFLRAIYADGAAPYTVEWDTDGDTVVDGTGDSIIRSFAAGTHPVSVTVTDSCASGAQSCTLNEDVVVNSVARPTITASGPLAFCAATGGSVTLTGPAGSPTYQWFRDAAVIPGATSVSYVATITGRYTLAITDSSGCPAVSLPVDVDADACGTPCPGLSCGGITITPDPSCVGNVQTLQLATTGGQGVVDVRWDVDGDTVADVIGNPVDVILPMGSILVAATATDQCTSPGPQTCSISAVATVNGGGLPLSEVSPIDHPPLLVNPPATRLTVEPDPAATAYNVHSDVIGRYAPSTTTGTTCHVRTVTDNGDGTISFDYTIRVNHWVVVSSSNTCGEGSAGRNTLGVGRATYAGWTGCGPAP